MYPEDYQQQDMPNMFESPESIARHILEVKKSKAGTINEDSARANLNPSELRCVRANGDFIADLEYAEKVCGWKLDEAKEYIKEKIATTNVPSRSKHGFAIVLSKTDRRISTPEAEHFAGEISNDFNEEVEQSLAEKVASKIPFLKKKEL
jgi:DNA segregation ATPase FtsK/SpoIIIE-like protein